MPRFPRPRRPKLPTAERIRERVRLPRRGKSDSEPAAPKPPLTTRLGSAARRVRYALGDAAYLVGRALEAIGRALVVVGTRARELWFRFSIHTRRRIVAVAILAGVAALVWFAAVPNLPCRFPGGDTCPPADDAAKIVPGDALAYAHANVDPESDQYLAATAIAARLPSLTEQLFALAPGPSGAPLDFETQVRPWLAGEVAVAVVPGAGGDPEQVLLFEIANTAGASAFAEGTASGAVSETDQGGVTIRTDQRGNSSAITSGFLLLGDEAAVASAIDVSLGDARPLTGSPLAEQVLDTLPAESVAEVAISEDGVGKLLADRDGPLGSLEAFVNFDATVGAGAAFVADEGAIELTLHSELDPERLKTSPGFFDAFTAFEPSLPEELAPATLAYLGLGDPASSIEDLFTQAIAEAPGIATGFDGLIDDLAQTGKLDVQSELLPLLQGEAAFSIQPAAPERQDEQTSDETEVPGEGIGPDDVPGEASAEELLPPEGTPPAPGVVAPTGVPYLLFVADEVDDAAAQESLAKLQGPLAEALNPIESLQAPIFQEREIEGFKASSLRLSRTVDLTYALLEGILVIATDPEGVAEVAGGDGGLSDSDRYEQATEGLPEEPLLAGYLNLTELLALAEREGLAEDPAYALFASDVRRLSALGLSVSRADTALETTVRIPVD